MLRKIFIFFCIFMSVNIVIYSIIPSFVAYIAMKNNTAFDYLTIMWFILLESNVALTHTSCLGLNTEWHVCVNGWETAFTVVILITQGS